MHQDLWCENLPNLLKDCCHVSQGLPTMAPNPHPESYCPAQIPQKGVLKTGVSSIDWLFKDGVMTPQYLVDGPIW